MEERVPLTARSPGHRVPAAERRSGTVVDEGSLELLEHLIAIVLQGNWQYLETLLQNEEILEVVDMHDNKGFTALHIASERVDVECVRALLEADANPNVMDRYSRTALHWVVSGGCHCDFCDSKRARCTELLLRAKGNLEIKDCKGETPLSYAAKNSFNKVATVMIEHGAEIHRTCNGVSTVELILQKVPEVMTQLLDQSVANDHDDNSKLKVDFKVLLQPPAPPKNKSAEDSKNSNNEDIPTGKRPHPQRELALIESFVSSSPPLRHALLKHPVTSTFLYLKWNYIWKWFWFVRILYTALAIGYTYFVFRLYLIKCPFDGDKGAAVNQENPGPEKCDAGLELLIAGICIGVWAILMALSTYYSLMHSFRLSCTSGLNAAWWLLIGCVTLTILPVFGTLNEYWRWQYFAAAFSVLLVWIMNFRHLSQIPVFGNYVNMFTIVLRRTIFGLLTFTTIFFGFVFGFCILFPKQSPYFQNISTASLRLFLLMLGEYEYDAIFTGSSTAPHPVNSIEGSAESHPVNSYEFWIGPGSHAYYIVFIIVFSIALMNLLIALAVNAVQQMESNAELAKICKQIEAIAHLESLLDDNWILNCLQKCILGQISVSRRNGRYFRLAPMDPKDKSLPPEIKAKFIPLVHTRECLNKKEMLPQHVRLPGHLGQGQTLNRNDPFRGSGHSQHSAGRPLGDIDDILIELKQKLEGLQRRRLIHTRPNPVFC